MAFEDELPAVPQDATTTTIDDQIDAGLFDEVPKHGDPVPAGTYHCRLTTFSEKSEAASGQPFYACQWAIQEEPLTGRLLFDNIFWVKPEDIRDANNPSNPRCQEAKALLARRLPRAKSIMEAAGFKATGSFKFKDFLNTHPEIKLQVSIGARKEKNAEGKYVNATSGEQQNNVVKYLSLARPS